MTLFQRCTLWIAVPVIYSWLRVSARLPDQAIACAFRVCRALAYPFVRDPGDLLQVDEVVKIFGEIPEQAAAVRRLILEARPGLLKAVIRGMLLHHVLT